MRLPAKVYHCAESRETVESILETGFTSDFVDIYENILISMLDQLPKKMRKEDLNKLFRHGNLIWTGTVPVVGYGDYCLEFRPPNGSIGIKVKDDSVNADIWAIWVPMSPIRPKYFKLLTNEQIDRLFDTEDQD